MSSPPKVGAQGIPTSSLFFGGFGDANRHFVIVFTCTLILAVLTYLQELSSFSFVYDDYIQLRGATEHWSRHGRWMADLIHNVLLQSSISPTLWLLLGLTILSGTATLIVFFIGHSELFPSTAAAYIIVANPYVHEIMHYNSQSVLYPLGVLFATVAIVTARPTAFATLAAAVMFSVAIGIYQVAIGYFVVILICLFLAGISNSQPTPVPLRSFRILYWTLATLIAMVAGLLLYSLVTEAYFFATDTPRNERVSLDFNLWHLFDRIFGRRGVYDRPLSSLFEASGGYADVSRYLLVTFLLIAVIVSSWAALRSNKTFNVGLVLILWALLVVAPLSYMIPLTGGGLSKPRLLGPFGVVLGFAILLSFRISSRHLRIMMVAAAVVLIASVVIRTNRLQFENQMRNLSDFALSVRILSRIESDPDFDTEKRYALVVMGQTPRNPDWGVLGKHGIYGSIGGSAFYADSSKRHIFMYFGYEFRQPTPEERALAEEYAARSHPWPDDSAVEVIDDVIFVILPDG